MIRLVPAAFFMLLLTACSTTHQLLEFNSPVRQDIGFSALQDSVQFIYSFHGPGNTIEVQVKNNSTAMLELYPEKSVIALNGEAKPWLPGSLPVAASVLSGNIPLNVGWPDTRSELTGNIAVPHRSLLVPAGLTAVITSPPMGMYMNADTIAPRAKRTDVLDNGNRFSLAEIPFSDTASPYKVQIHLAYTVAGAPVRYRQDSFYLSSLYRTSSLGLRWLEAHRSRGHSFFKSSTRNTAAGTVAGVAVLAGVIALAASSETTGDGQ